MKYLIAFLITVFQVQRQVKCCSRSSDYRPPTIADAFKKAQVVALATVLNKSEGSFGDGTYNATMNITTVFKGKIDDKQITVSGFGQGATCMTYVENATQYIVFMDKDPFRVVANLEQSAAFKVTSENLHDVNVAVCCFTPSDCQIADYSCSGATNEMYSLVMLFVVHILHSFFTQ